MKARLFVQDFTSFRNVPLVARPGDTDEPAAGLSPTERSELIEILTGLPGHVGYIIIEHDMDVALRVSEFVTMMHNGRIFKEGSPQEIEEDPEVQELYLGGGLAHH